MRVAYVCADQGVPVFGTKGSSVHVQEVLRALRRRGAEVVLLAARTGGEPPADLADLEVVALPRAKADDPARRERRCMEANEEALRLLAAQGRVDAVYERYSLWGTAGTAYARRCGIRSVLEVNAPLPDEQARHRVLVHAAEADAVARRALAAAGTVLAVSEPVAAWARAMAPATAVEVVPNGVDPDRFAPAVDARRGRGGPFTVGFVGTLKPWHGLEVLVDAVAALGGDARLLLVGDGPLREAVAARAAAVGLGGRLEAVGAVDPAGVPALLGRADVGVAPYPPSTSDYFSPLKVYEYLAAGLPVVASRVGQTAQVLVDGETGVLVEPGDPAALAAALRALRDDVALRERLGSAGRRLVLAERTWDAVARRILDALAADAGGADLGVEGRALAAVPGRVAEVA